MENSYLVLLMVFIFGTTNSISENTLLSVVQVFRHGERTPVFFYLTDPYKDSSYWNGLGTGQLTAHGKVQAIKLGQYFREKYDGFVSANYSEQEIYVRTVSGNRNLQTAEAFLTGLYPDEKVDIPIHLSSPAVMGSLTECLRYDFHWLNMEFNNDYFKRVKEENSEDYKYIREHAIFPLYELMGAYVIWDTLHIEYRYNYTLPEWTDTVFPEKLTKMSNMYALSLCYDETLQKLGAGPFINELINHFESILLNGAQKKIQLYSAHDVNIACLLNSFDAFAEPHIPDFASSLVFELRKDNENSYINAYYKPNDQLIPINLRGCDFNCKIEDFKSIFSNIVITELEWVEKCFSLF